MSRVVVYTCDRCGHEQRGWDTPQGDDSSCRQLYTVHVQIGRGASFSSDVGKRRYVDADRLHTVIWCDRCALEMGVRRPAARETAPSPVPSVEDLIREIVREEMSSQ